jgi:predicted Ser/Thr protein kinase
MALYGDTSRDQVLSMEIFEEHDSLYRVLRSDNRIVYITIAPGILTLDEFDFPPNMLKRLGQYSAWKNRWKTLYVSIDSDGIIQLSEDISNPHSLPVHLVRNHQLYNILSLHIIHKFNHRVFLVHAGENNVILKIARFPFELPWLVNEISVYEKLEASNSQLAPRLLGLVFKDDKERVVGFLCEEIHGEVASQDDYSACEVALQTLHNLQILHGDLNRHNIIVTADAVKFIDFEDSVSSLDEALKRKEMEALTAALVETSGRGAPLSP